MTPWLSVVVPVHDGAHFLEATLASAAAEQPDGVEFILLDSSADDGASRRVAERFAGQLHLDYHATPECKPWTAKTNRAARLARASHLAMLHQDDLWLAGHVAAVRQALALAPEAALSIAPSRFIDRSGRDVGGWRLPFRAGTLAPADFCATLLVQNTIAIPSPVIRRDAWLACGGLAEDLWYTADWDLYLKLGRLGPVYVRPKATTAFRLHGSSLTMTGSRDAADFRRQLERVVEAHRGAVPAARRGRAVRMAETAITLNCMLAGASGAPRIARLRGALAAATRLLALGPLGVPAFLKRTRLVDRVVPRLRLTFSGSM